MLTVAALPVDTLSRFRRPANRYDRATKSAAVTVCDG